MLRRIIHNINKQKIVTEESLCKAPSIGRLWQESDIPIETVREYCHRLCKAGYIYNYGGVYKLAQFIPFVKFAELTEMSEDDRMLYEYNRLHSLGYPYCDERIYRSMSMLDHFHLLQYMRFNDDIYEFKIRFKKESSYVDSFINHMIQYDYITVKDGCVDFTGKYIPFSITAKNFKLHNYDKLDVSYTLAKEEDLIDSLGSHIGKRIFKSKAFDNIEFIKNYYKSMGGNNPRMLKALYDSWNII